jgi:broad specificity phosphatase PhoE
LDSDDKGVLKDASLVEEGIKQVRDLGEFWMKSIRDDGVPFPETFYTSPLARCLQTTEIAFSRLGGDLNKPFHPTVKELIRERLTTHTCDWRGPRSSVESKYSNYLIEAGMSEEDQLWNADREETEKEHTARKQIALEDIFSTDPNQFISITTHSFAISAFLAAVGARTFRVREGSTIPLFIKATKLEPRHS